MIKQNHRAAVNSRFLETDLTIPPHSVQSGTNSDARPSWKASIGNLFLSHCPSVSAALKGPLWVAAFALLSVPVSADVVIDAFERTNISPWFFYGEGGATGGLTLGTGRSGKGALLSYDLSRGGVYGAAILPLRTPVTASAISLWLRSPANIFARLQVIDSDGQTHQYTLNRPFTATNPNAWYQQVVALNGPDSSFGGQDDGVIRFPIVEIRLLALEPPEPGARESLSFDDVVAVTSLAYTLNPAGTVIPGPAQTGDLPSNMGVAIHLPESDRGLNAARDAGFKWARTDLFWSDVETTQNEYVWTKYDQLVNALKSRGMQALLILGYGNDLYTDGFLNPPDTPDEIRAYANFAEAAARRYASQGVRFEVWNEGNHGNTFWDPAQYGVAAKEAISRVHLVNPTMKVSTTGLAGFDYAYLRQFLSQGGGTGADAIAVHPYDISNPPNGLVEKYLHLKSILFPYYSTLPALWNTEWGFTSTDFATAEEGAGHNAGARRRQAILAAREMLSSYAVGFPLSIYYDLRDDGDRPTEREDNFGLLARNYTEKPAMTAIKTLTRFTRARTFRGFLPTTPTSLVAMRFDGTNDKVVALWLSARGSSVTVTLPTGATAANVLGAPVTIQNNRIVLREVDGPVYVTSR